MQEYAASASEVLVSEARTALEACGPLDADAGAVNQISSHMKRKSFPDARRVLDKKARADATDNAAAANDTTVS